MSHKGKKKLQFQFSKYCFLQFDSDNTPFVYHILVLIQLGNLTLTLTMISACIPLCLAIVTTSRTIATVVVNVNKMMQVEKVFIVFFSMHLITVSDWTILFSSLPVGLDR